MGTEGRGKAKGEEKIEGSQAYIHRHVYRRGNNTIQIIYTEIAREAIAKKRGER